MSVGAGLAPLQVEQDVGDSRVVLRLLFASRLGVGGVLARGDAGRLGVGGALGDRVNRRSADIRRLAQGVGMDGNEQRCVGVARHRHPIVEIDIFVALARHRNRISTGRFELPLELRAKFKDERLFHSAAESTGASVGAAMPRIENDDRKRSRKARGRDRPSRAAREPERGEGCSFAGSEFDLQSRRRGSVDDRL